MKSFKDLKAEIMNDPARVCYIKRHIAKFKGEMYVHDKGKKLAHRRWADYFHPRRKK